MKNIEVLKKVIGQLTYAPGDYVTLIHDPEEIPFFVAAITVGADKGVMYSIVSGVVERTAFAIELQPFVPSEQVDE